MIHAFVLALLLATPALSEAVEAPGRLTDAAFHRLLACPGPQEQECARLMRWDSTRPVRIALRQIDPAFLGRKKLRAAAALERAVQEINDADIGLRLALVTGAAEIEVFFLDISPDTPIAGTEMDGVDGVSASAVTTRVRFNHASGQLERAALVFTPALATPRYEAAMLRAVARSLGLLTPVSGAPYDKQSVFAAGSNRTTLGPQDIAALRLHYER